MVTVQRAPCPNSYNWQTTTYQKGHITNYRQLPLRVITCVGLVFLFQYVCVQTYGDSSVALPAYPVATPATWEYAQRDARTIINCKYTEYSWQWTDAHKDFVGYKGRSENSVIRDLCHRIATQKVDAHSHKARNTHLVLLDTIGVQGWEMVDHSEVIKDFPIDSSDKDADTSGVMARKWLFKRQKAGGNL